MTWKPIVILQFIATVVVGDLGEGYSLISRVQTECELEALSYGTKLADSYNYFDEETEWDMRIHNDYMTEHLGFAGWIQSGLWKSGGMTAEKQNAPTLQRVNVHNMHWFLN
jgi:hypothetical protein